MRIATELGWGHKIGGARRVAIKTLLALTKLYPENEYLLYSNSHHSILNDKLVKQVRMSPPSFIPQVLWDQFIFPHYAVPRANRQFRPDVIHHTNNIVSFWGKVPAVVTIHDMTPFLIPETFRKSHGMYQRAYFRFAARKAVKIITVSENSRQDICNILNVPPEKVVVAPLAVDLVCPKGGVTSLLHRLRKKNGLKSPFILYVGAIHPRKNVARVVRAFAQLKKTKRIPHKLIIAGEFRWMPDQVMKEIENAKIAEHCLFLKDLTDPELACLYSSCEMLVWPSLYEGFGLPVLEAMSLGAPVVTSNCSSLPEVAGDAALLVDPRSIDEIANAMWRILNEPDLANRLREKGRHRASQFSWVKTAQILANVFESVV